MEWKKEGTSFDEILDKQLDYKRSLSEKALYPNGENKDDGASCMIPSFMTKQGIRTNKIHTGPLKTWMISQGKYSNTSSQACTIIWASSIQKKTPSFGDRGADIVVTSKTLNLLIQCKQTSSGKNMNPGGVQEIVTSLNPYSLRMGRTFKGVVITNAPDFTREAKELARANGIELIARDGLSEKLKKYPLKKGLYGI